MSSTLSRQWMYGAKVSPSEPTFCVSNPITSRREIARLAPRPDKRPAGIFGMSIEEVAYAMRLTVRRTEQIERLALKRMLKIISREALAVGVTPYEWVDEGEDEV